MKPSTDDKLTICLRRLAETRKGVVGRGETGKLKEEISSNKAESVVTIK